MCGIVGLFLKNPDLEPRLGALMVPMLEAMTERGPDSAGFALYGATRPDIVKLTLRATSEADFSGLTEALKPVLGTAPVQTRRSTHAVVEVPLALEAAARAAIAALPSLTVVGAGHAMELYKEVGLPIDVAHRFGLAGMSGSHTIAHTRMATESAVTTLGAHPFSTGTDQCLVHNGSLSNHNDLRRRLIREGGTFATENDSEVAAGYLSWRLAQGASLGEALEAGLADLDGFFTFVVGTETGFGVVRDPIGCKPAVMAETDDWVAFGSEYRALTGLPGIDDARLFEPEPAKVYFWERAA